MKKRPDLYFESAMTAPVAGLDEAGCGPWAGVLVAAAVILPNVIPDFIEDVNDSKKLTRVKREDLFDRIITNSHISVGVGIVSVAELDELLLRGALPLAFRRAVETLNQTPASLLIDGIRNPKLSYPTHMIKQGDQLSLSIATASIIAKVTRDRLMDKLHDEYPAYGWGQNAGYGTKMHRDALDRLGVTPHHRKSYAPIKQYILRKILYSLS